MAETFDWNAMKMDRLYRVRRGKWRDLAGLLIAVLCVVAIGACTYWDWVEQTEAVVRARAGRAVVAEANGLLARLTDAESAQRGYLLTGNDDYLAPYQSALADVPKRLSELQRRVGESSLFTSLREEISQRTTELAKTVALARDGKMGAARAMIESGRGKQSMDRIRALCDRIVAAETSRLESLTSSFRPASNRRRVFVLSASAVLVLLLAASAIRIRNSLAERDAAVEDLAVAHEQATQAWRSFETTLRSIGDAVISADARGEITFMNKVSEQLTGWSSEQAVGRPLTEVFQIVDEHTHEPVENPVSRVLREGVVVGLANHTVLLARDGREIPIDDSGAPIRDASGALSGVVLVFHDVSQRREAERQLWESERRHRLMFENNPQPMWVFDVATLEFLAVNDAALKKYGYSRDEFLRMTLRDIRPAEDVPALLEDVRSSQPSFHTDGPWRHRTKNGAILYVEVTVHPIDYMGRDARVVLAHDITERLRLEEQLRQAQRLEAVGRLAGGVAHDFNNLLTIILGYAYSLQTDSGKGRRLSEAANEIVSAGERAASLTRQLLAFSRSQILQPRIINLNTAIQNLRNMLGRLLGENIEIETRTDPALWLVRADPGQIDQVILNIAINARDAMSGGGTLAFSTSNVRLDAAAAAPLGISAGEYVALRIADTGHGMTPETKARIFEPFFTTKEVGLGTGLGLATVYGIVTQSGGAIAVESELGRGSSFTVYLPRSTEPEQATAPPPARPPKHDRGNEHILVVEDDHALRKLTSLMLESQGYRVMTAGSLSDALRALNHAERIDLLISDLVLPEAGGLEVARRIRERYSHIKVLFMSGYSENAAADAARIGASGAFLRKPFTQQDLASKVREVLDSLDTPAGI